MLDEWISLCSFPFPFPPCFCIFLLLYLSSAPTPLKGEPDGVHPMGAGCPSPPEDTTSLMKTN
eukprot:NODE_16625_length_308_cov_1.420849_g15458_i0.p2 GENE.NODE_16625_length_308_cov_1.420849_g15458_i0~~NODE_16625_length_308_cov_1.420849_g15458_i0.p2  ORF type:complete len:63 (-),score=6.80 NODE_16625_length_308_cov_1.420849_g15458_i0:47-235(-)